MTQPLTITAAWERPVTTPGIEPLALHLALGVNSTFSTGSERAPLDLAFVLDRSGSMHGDRLELVKEALLGALALLTPADRIAVVLFDDQIETLLPLTPCTKPARIMLREHLRHVDARGSTDLSTGWLTGCQILATASPTGGQPRLQRAVLLTDGHANQGIVDRGELARHANVLRRTGITTSAIGIGNGYDEVLLEAMVEGGGGAHNAITTAASAREVFASELKDLTTAAITAPHLTLALPIGVSATLLNQFPTQQVENHLHIDLRDLVAGEELHLILMVTIDPCYRSSTLTLTLRCQGTITSDGTPIDRTQHLPFLTIGTLADVALAPVDPTVVVRRTLEESNRDQREALRLDREQDFAGSRAMFTSLGQRMAAAQNIAASANLDSATVDRLSSEQHLLSALAAAPSRPLGEDIHKERAAFRSRASRGQHRS